MKYVLLGFLAIMSSTSMATAIYDYADVSDVTAEYSVFKKTIKSENCKEVSVMDRSRGSQMSSNPIGGIIGGVLGGVLGHQVGGGVGKTAATIGGAILGTQVGAAKIGGSSNSAAATYHTERRCTPSYDVVEDRVVTGYRIYVVYNSRSIMIKSKKRYAVGERVRIRADVSIDD